MDHKEDDKDQPSEGYQKAPGRDRAMESGVTDPVTEKFLPLPQKVPKVPKLVFTGPKEGWPPRPQEQLDVREVHVQEIPGSLTDDLEDQIRMVATQNERVQALLGDRFAYINTDSLQHLSKGQHFSSSRPLATRVTFFSYTNNVAVEVLMQGLNMESVTRHQGYQPPEGDDEIKEAIALARADSRLQDKVQELHADAILLPATGEQPGHNHRLLWVTFSDPEESYEEKVTLFSASVDLTDQKVLVVRPEPGLNENEGYRSDAE